MVFILPLFLSDKVFAVYLAEPIADIVAATCTGTVFFLRFRKILDKRSQDVHATEATH